MQQAVQRIGGPEADDRLVARMAGGDDAALAELIERLGPRIRRYVSSRVEDGPVVDEVVGDVFFTAWRQAARFRGDSSVSTWLHGIARFVASRAVRARRARKRAMLVPVDPELLEEVEAQGPGPSLRDHLEARSDVRRLAPALASLPPGQARCLWEGVVVGESYAEVARRMGVGEDVVKQRIARARARLRRP